MKIPLNIKQRKQKKSYTPQAITEYSIFLIIFLLYLLLFIMPSIVSTQSNFNSNLNIQFLSDDFHSECSIPIYKSYQSPILDYYTYGSSTFIQVYCPSNRSYVEIKDYSKIRTFKENQ